MFTLRIGVLMTKGVVVPNGMLGLGRKLVNSFVNNVGGMLKEIFEDQRKLVPYGIRVSQGAVVGVREAGRQKTQVERRGRLAREE